MLQLDEMSLYAAGLALLEQNLHTLDAMGLFEDQVFKFTNLSMLQDVCLQCL